MMHTIIQLRRIAKQGFHNFFRNAWLSIAATAIMVVTLTIIIFSFALNMILNDNIEAIASRVTVAVFLNENVDTNRRAELETALESSFNVKSVRFIDKEEAYNKLLELSRDNPAAISGLSLTGNILPESFEVELLDLSQVDSVRAVAEEERFNDIVDETSVNETSKEAIDNIAKAQDYISIGSFVAAGIFAAISILVIFNTIRMTVFTRQYEIEIMKLIGATPWYIRGPFLAEAMLYGVFAGVVTTVVFYSALLNVGTRVSSDLYFDETINFFVDNWFLVFPMLILVGIAIGLVSSFVSMRRYLRLKHW